MDYQFEIFAKTGKKNNQSKYVQVHSCVKRFINFSIKHNQLVLKIFPFFEYFTVLMTLKNQWLTTLVIVNFRSYNVFDSYSSSMIFSYPTRLQSEIKIHKLGMYYLLVNFHRKIIMTTQ